MIFYSSQSSTYYTLDCKGTACCRSLEKYELCSNTVDSKVHYYMPFSQLVQLNCQSAEETEMKSVTTVNCNLSSRYVSFRDSL
jgi:hypothetical protein